MDNDTQPDDKQPGQVAEQPAEYTAAPAPTGRTKVLKNGAIYDMDVKRIVVGPPGGGVLTGTAITQSNANEYHELSREKRLDAVYRGLAAGTRRSNAHDAVEAIVARQAELAMAIDRGRASTEAARFTFQAGELIQDRRLDSADGLTITAHASLGALETLRAILEQARTGVREQGDRFSGTVGDIVDGQVRDTGNGTLHDGGPADGGE